MIKKSLFTSKAFLLAGAFFISNSLNPIYANPDPDFPNTHVYQLDNGLKVIIREDHRAPVVINMVWYKVGAVDEPRGLGGLSHMLEHMMFKGTHKLGPNEHSLIVANLGGRDNAFTSYDFTAYFESLPVWALEKALELESDRMQNLVLKEEDFTPERLVVAEERRQRTDSNPQSQLYETLMATTWTTSAYRNPIIGWMPEIHSWTLSDLKTWYKRYYAPNNATIVIVGDVNPAETFTLIKKYFGDIPPSQSIEYPNEFEGPQKGEKRVNLNVPANQPLLFMAYKTPSINSVDDKNDAYAMIVISEILDGLYSSRLTKHLVREQKIALETGTYYNAGMRYGTTLIISAVPTQDVDLATLEDAVKKEIHRLKTEPVSQGELTRVLNRYYANSIYAKDSVYAQALEIGRAETTGVGWKRQEQIQNELNKITPERIQEVAKKYLIDDHLTISTLYSTPKNP